MLYEVDFSIKISENFSTIHTAFIHALSVSECQGKAKTIRDTLPQMKEHQVHIFIKA